MYRFFKIALSFFLLFSIQVQALSIIDIKGVMLQRISSFIDWPELPQDKMKICIVGNKEFAQRLQELYKSKTIHELPLEVIFIDNINDIKTLQSCQIIYIEDTKKDEVQQISQLLKTNTTLIIGNKSDNINDGVSVVLHPDKNRFKIIINKTMLDTVRLKADYRLLKLAKVVELNGVEK